MKVLIVEDEKEILDLLKFSIDFNLKGAQIHSVSNHEEGVKFFEEASNLDLVMCDHDISGSCRDFIHKIRIVSKEAKIAIVSSVEKVFIKDIDHKDIYHFIDKSSITSDVEDLIQKFGTTDDFQRNNRSYVPIGINLLKAIGICPSDIFIKISSEKYIKIHREKDVFTDEEVRSYQRKEIDFLYILKTEQNKSLDIIQDHINFLLSHKKGPVNLEDTLVVNKLIFNAGREFGINEQLMEMTAGNTKMAMSIINSNDELKNKLAFLFENSHNYIPSHSLGLSILTCCLAKELGWGSDATFCKLTFASLVHDLTLSDTEATEYEILKTNDEVFQEHPSELASLVSKINNVPPDVDRIILEHHELPDGSGFPLGKPYSLLYPLSCLFITSHRIIDLIIESKRKGINLTQQSVIEVLENEGFNKGTFKKILKALERITLF